MKYLLILISITCYCEDSFLTKMYKDFGLKLRLGSIFADHELEGDSVQLGEAEFEGKAKFPIIPVFKSTDGHKSYTQIFFEYEFPSESLNQLALGETNRSEVKSKYLEGSALSFVNSNPDWGISGDVSTWSVAIGYQWGAFIRLSDSSRLFKIGAGPLLGYLNYKYSLNLCSEYSKNPKSISLRKISSGECENKTKLDELSFSGFGYGIAVNFTVYELIKKKWILSLLNFEVGILIPFKGEKLNSDLLTVKNSNETFKMNAQYGSVDLIGFSYFFN